VGDHTGAGVRAKTSFWLDGGYDAVSVHGCPRHPRHDWWTFRLGDVVENCGNADELMTICRACYVPRCGTTADVDRCTLWRHHETEHVMESGATIAVGA
jgi:hypothetical protein